MKKFRTLAVLLAVAIISVTIFSGCSSDADVASKNLSKSAEQFEIERRIVFYNGVTDNYILSIEGKCSVDFFPLKFEVTCKTGASQYRKHYLGRADNVFPFIEQLKPADVSTYRYKVIFKPTSIIPDIDLE